MKNEKCWYKNVCTYDYCTNCIRYSEMRYLMDSSGIPANRQHPQGLVAGIDIDKYYQLSAIKDDIVNFVNNGENLLICSKYTGNGKTSWALKLMLKYFDEIWAGNGFRVRGLFVNVPTLLLQLKNFNNPISEEYKKQLMNADLVVWDEIASTSISNYDYGNLLMFIDHRIFSEKSNIFTSNATTQEDLEKSIGAKLTSRIWNCSEVIEFKGKDRRHGSVADY